MASTILGLAVVAPWAQAITPNLDFNVVDEASYQAFNNAIEKSEYVRYKFVNDPRPRVVGAAAGLVLYATTNPLATEAQLTTFVNAYDTALAAHAAGDPHLQRSSHLISAIRFELPLGGEPTLAGTNTSLGAEIAEFLELDVPAPDGFNTNERRVVLFEQARGRELANSAQWSTVLMVGFSGQDLEGAPNEHLAGVLETYLTGQGYSPFPPTPVPCVPSIIGNASMPGFAQGVAVSGSLAYVAVGTSGLRVVDISDPANPSTIGSVDTPDNALDVAVSGTLAYVADLSSGLQVIDVTDPADPSIIGAFDTPGFAVDVAVSGTTAYVADISGGLQIIDVGDPMNPSFLGSFAASGQTGSVEVRDSLAYITDTGSRSLLIIDVSNPANPSLVGEVDTFFPIDIALSGNTAYIADETLGLSVVDISDPANPTVIGAVDPTEPFGLSVGVAVSGGVVYLAEDIPGLQVIDVSDPTNPVIIGMVGASIGSVAVDGTLAYATGGAGLDVIDVSACTNPVVAALTTLPIDFATFDALLSDPFAASSFWDSIATCLDGIRLETEDRLAELSAALIDDDLVQGVANVNDPVFMAEREANYLAKLDLVADDRAIVSASTLMMLQSSSSPTRDLAGRARTLAALQLNQNNTGAAVSEGVKYAAGIGLILAGAATGNPVAIAAGFMAATGGAVGLSDILGGGPSEEEEIFNQIVEMRQQIADMQFQLNGRFDRIETQLNVVFTALATGFNEIGMQIGDLMVTVESIERNLQVANAKLERIEDVLWSIADAILQNDLALLTNEVLNFRSGGVDFDYTASDPNFLSAMSDLFTFATTTAIMDVYAGDLVSTLTVANAASRLNDDSIGRQINDLRVFPQNELGLTALLNQRVAAPSLWAQSASAYSQVARESPWYFAFMYENQLLAGTPELDQIISLGQNMESNAANGRDQALFDRLFSDWRDALAAAGPALDIIIADVAGGLDPWGGVNQPVRQIPLLPNFSTLRPPDPDLALGFPTLQIFGGGSTGWDIFSDAADGQPELSALLGILADPNDPDLNPFVPLYFWRQLQDGFYNLIILGPPSPSQTSDHQRTLGFSVVRKIYDCGNLMSEVVEFHDPVLWPLEFSVLNEAWVELRPLLLQGAPLPGGDVFDIRFQDDGNLCIADPGLLNGAIYYLRVRQDLTFPFVDDNIVGLQSLQDQVWSEAAQDQLGNLQLVEDDLQGLEALIESYITLSMPDLMEQSTIARAALRADRGFGELSLSLPLPLPALLGSFQESMNGDGDVNPWPAFEAAVLANSTFLQDEVDAAIASPSVGHSYVNYMLAELQDLQAHAFKLAIDDAYEANQDQMRVIPAGQGVLVNDVDQLFRTIQVDTAFVLEPEYVPPQNGIVALNADGSFSYTPDPGFIGVDSFNYRSWTDRLPSGLAASRGIDPTVFSDPATVVVIVEAPVLCLGDSDGSGTVNFGDITAALGNWLNDYTPGTGLGDANGDGIVNFGDITSVLGNWLSVCP